MSLETVIAELTATVAANNELLKQVLAADEAKGGDKPKATRTKKADAAADAETKTTETDGTGDTTEEAGASAEDVKALKDLLSAWLGEFAKPEDKDNPEGAHPEVVERKAALSKAFGQLNVKSLKDVKTAEQLTKLNGWFKKAKDVDKGHGKGRFAADPVEATEEDDNELDV